MDRVYPYIVTRKLYGCGLGCKTHRAFRRVVAHVDELLSRQSGDRRDINDQTVTGLLHSRDYGTHAQKDTTCIDVHLFVPGVCIEHVRMTAGHAGIVDQDINTAKRGQRFRNNRSQCSSLVTSSLWKRAFSPISAARAVPSASSISVKTTLAPSAANSLAVAAPIPDDAPVKMATLFISRVPKSPRNYVFVTKLASLTTIGDRTSNGRW